MAWSANLMEHGIPSSDPQPVVIETDSTGTEFGRGYPGYLGAGRADQPVDGPADSGGDIATSGMRGVGEYAASIPTSAMLRTNSAGYAPNPEYGGQAGRWDRLAYDSRGPAHSGSVESHAMNGARIKPGRPDLARGGPVGASGDLGQYLAVAMAQSTYDFPPQDLAQLNILLGI